MIDDSILEYSVILFVFLSEKDLLFFLQRVIYVFVLYILIFNFDHILFVLINNAQQLALNLSEVLAYFVFVQVASFLFDDELWIDECLPERISISSWFFFFIVEFQWFLMELSVRPGSILVI